MVKGKGEFTRKLTYEKASFIERARKEDEDSLLKKNHDR